MIRSFSIVVPILAALALTGCSADAAPRPIASGSASSRAAHVPVGIPDGVVGTAALTTVAGGQSMGTVTFRRSGSTVALEVPSLGAADPSTVIWALADSPFSTSTCGSDNVWEIGFPASDPHGPHLDDNMFAGSDPSFLTSVVVVTQTPSPEAGGCSQPILATGPIVWTVPMQRPWVHPRDRGAGPGARGTVKTNGGSPTLYTTAADDSWSAIAARFRISADDLAWLNPNRLGGGEPGEAYTQQVLNLDPQHRGDSESRRPH